MRVYREIRHHFGDPDGLGRSIQATAQALNQELFSEPLPVAEVDHIARSIHRWIITKSRMWADGPAVYEATFTTIQAARGKKGGRRSAERRWGTTNAERIEGFIND
ncbi:primase C-terminal domain-containing protein [Corynebacterium casei]|uniref:primase C-terminal domain-containing protein n=1 Tax=Actinomycetes TaxID=1760 RepID=UPI001CECEC9C|nr:primase C-terminal domain-containing protein [Corynebacterium casei]MDN5783159.1 primase C-terminal domain-containing protein [Corynebacterium casei]MDN5841423.1 primase C-terminal domain-containing protein [Corynebacterium casei]